MSLKMNLLVMMINILYSIKTMVAEILEIILIDVPIGHIIMYMGIVKINQPEGQTVTLIKSQECFLIMVFKEQELQIEN